MKLLLDENLSRRLLIPLGVSYPGRKHVDEDDDFRQLSFLLWKVLTAKRWELLKALCGAGPVSVREAARRVDRDVKGVHGDVTALLEAGVLDRAEGGGIVFPHDVVKVEFMLQAA